MEHEIMTNSPLGSMQWGLSLIFPFSCPWRPNAFSHVANTRNCGAQNCCADQGEFPWMSVLCIIEPLKSVVQAVWGLNWMWFVSCPGSCGLAWDEGSDGPKFGCDLCWVIRQLDFFFIPFLFCICCHELVVNIGVPCHFCELCSPDNCYDVC